MTQVLAEQSQMLSEYFSITFAKSASDDEPSSVLRLTALPVLLDGHRPEPFALPLFLMRLATEVNYSEEKPCFEGVCAELGNFYAELPLGPPIAEESDKTIGNLELIDAAAGKYLQHVIYPAISYLLMPPKEFLTDGTVTRMALLSSLYKVFERC